MKFRGFVLFIILFLVGIMSASATTIDYHEGLKCDPYIVEADGRVSMQCKVGFQVKDGSAYYNSLRGSLTLNNVEFAGITASGDWHVESKDNKNFYLTTSKTKLDEGYHVVATIKFYKIDREKECSVIYEFSFSNETRKCMNYHGTYYGKDGKITDKKTYELECLKHACEIVDGHYFNKEGKEVSHLDYQKSCEINICKILSDGTHYGKDGTVVTASEYRMQCEKPAPCEVRDGKYYDKEGKEVSHLDYQKACEKNICKILSDGTRYGKDGTVVSEEEYKKQCEKAPVCEVRDGKYYGKDGEEVDERTYRTTCEVHKCQIIGDIYFDDKGRIVSEDEFDAACNAPIDNPQTGATMSYAFVATLLLGVFGGLKYLKRQNKIYHL